MQKQIFEFMGRRIELWTHPDPDHPGRVIRTRFGYVPRGRHAATPTYVFSASDQERRMRRLLAGQTKPGYRTLGLAFSSWPAPELSVAACAATDGSDVPDHDGGG